MAGIITIRRGLDIPIAGEAEKICINAPPSETYCLKPADFHGIVPSLCVKEGDEVLAGTPVFFSKQNPKIKFTSPVSGQVVEIRRGEKRKILFIRILPDKEIQYKSFLKGKPAELSREQILGQLLDAGVWPFLRQIPYGIIADPDDNPKGVVVSAFDTHPLAPDYDFIVHGHGEEFQAGLDAIGKIVNCKIHLNINAISTLSKVFLFAKGVQLNKFSGPHPAGNPSVQVNRLDPVNKGEKVWYLSPQAVLTIGRLFLEGRYNASKMVAVTGPVAKNRKYFRILQGASIKGLCEYDRNAFDVRFISGNPLTGTQITAEGVIGFYDDQVTLLAEGNRGEFMGWLTPGFGKYSHSKTFFSRLFSGKYFKLDTNMHGEKRPFVVTGQYEDVFPMNIFPQHLVKAIIIKDIELMENLGIYEVVPEDFALCEFVCTSKMELQKLVREGLDYIHKECG